MESVQGTCKFSRMMLKFVWDEATPFGEERHYQFGNDNGRTFGVDGLRFAAWLEFLRGHLVHLRESVSPEVDLRASFIHPIPMSCPGLARRGG